MARVLSVIAASSFSTSRLKVSGLISTNRGFAPFRQMEEAVAKKVKGVVITSLSAPIPVA